MGFSKSKGFTKLKLVLKRLNNNDFSFNFVIQITYLLILCVHYDGYLHVYYSLFTGGFFGGGLLIIPPLWISEIASDR